jgi:hypothetical protein
MSSVMALARHLRRSAGAVAVRSRPVRAPILALPSSVPMATEPVYSVTEARALVPQVRAVLLQLAVERHGADRSHAALHHHLGATPAGDRSAQGRLEAETSEHRARVEALLDHLASLGIVVRDIEAGLVDFPTIRDGEPAWLCWRLDDVELAWWHTTREGYASRRPL